MTSFCRDRSAGRSGGGAEGERGSGGVTVREEREREKDKGEKKKKINRQQPPTDGWPSGGSSATPVDFGAPLAARGAGETTQMQSE